ncbi:hypothetical protein [Micromonospora coxensis]|uniref:Uncharacterized protein n=1 Tax=Micromonospora coxensis TaxID=356852 RepID=A0A1C5IHN7_9ACTN|nr:hypothetical protein [Micromonospora coxensis]SCG57912.1 hypothetical protein GA0070614_2834 [Micromonospora coxensis]
MIAAHIRIASLTSTCGLDESELRDLIHAQATPAAAVEHIRIRAGPHGVDILAFLDSDDPKEAAEALHHLVDKAIASTPLLRTWRII